MQYLYGSNSRIVIGVCHVVAEQDEQIQKQPCASVVSVSLFIPAPFILPIHLHETQAEEAAT